MKLTERLAFEVELDGICSICFAATRKAAEWQAIKSWRDACGFSKRWPNRVKAWRRPELDAFPYRDRETAWTEAYVRAFI